MVGIYKITSPSRKVYIGQSWDIKERFRKYGYSMAPKQTLLQYSFNKYGANNHKFEIIHELPKDVEQEVLDRYEQLYMDQYKECGIILLNCREAGSHGKMSEDSKKKMSLKKINNYNGKNNPFYGKKHSSESLKRMSDIKIGKLLSKETREKMSKAQKGRISPTLGMKHSQKTKKRMSNSQKGKGVKTIIQYDLKGNKIKEWGSLTKVYNKLKIHISNISKCAKGEYAQAGGFKWKYKNNTND